MNCDRDTVDVNKCQVGAAALSRRCFATVPEISEVCLKALAANEARTTRRAA